MHNPFHYGPLKISHATENDLSLMENLRQGAIAEKTEPKWILRMRDLQALAPYSFDNPDNGGCYIASAPAFPSLHPLPIEGAQACGFIVYSWGHDEDEHPNSLGIDHLYTVRSPYPTGHMLMSLAIREAADNPEIKAIHLRASSPRSQKWYAELGFLSKDDEMTKSKWAPAMQLFKENFLPVQQAIEKQIKFKL